MKILKIILILIATAILTACAGPKVQMHGGLPSDIQKQVTLRVPDNKNHKILNHYLEITKIDEKRTISILEAILLYGGRHGASEVYLTPGMHTVELRYMFFGRYADVTVGFEGIEGEKYIAKVSIIEENKANFWIEHEKTGQLVSSGIKKNK